MPDPMDDLHLFELINAPAAVHPTRLLLALLVARWAVWLVPLGALLLWARGDAVTRRELVAVALAALWAGAIAEALRLVWPHPRPAALRLGTQYLAHAGDSGLPSDQATVVWALALAVLRTQRLSVWCFPLLTAGLVLGLSRVYVGVNFPYDILAALPVAALGALAAGATRRWSAPIADRFVAFHDRCARRLRMRFRPVPPA